MRPADFLMITFLVLNLLTAVDFGNALGGALPQLPSGFQPVVEAPPPTAGGDVSSSPSLGWWVASGSPPPEASPRVPSEEPVTPPSIDGGIPFISSSAAVPLPAAETGSATFRPLPTPGQEAQETVGIGSMQRVRVLLVLATIIMSSALVLWM